MSQFHQDIQGQPSGLPGRDVYAHHRQLRLSGPVQQKTNALTPAFVLKSVRQWWLASVPIGLLLAAGAGAVVFLTFKPEYSAEALLQITYSYIVSPVDRPPRPSELIATQRELMRTPMVLGPVLEETAKYEGIKDAEDQVRYLADHIQVNSLGETGLFTVSFTSTNPEQAADVVNRVVEEYLVFQRGRDESRWAVIIDKLKGEEKILFKQIDSQTKEILGLEKEALERDPFSSQVGDRQVVNRLPLANISEKLIEVGYDSSRSAAELASLEEELRDEKIFVPAAMVSDRVESHPEVLRIQAEIALHEEQIQEIESKFKQGSYPVIHGQLVAQRDRHETSLEEKRKELTAEVRAQMAEEMHLAKTDQIAELKAKLDSLADRKAYLDAENKRVLGELLDREGPALDLELARGELERTQAIYDRIRDRRTSIELELNAPENVTLMDDARPPKIPLERIPYKQILMAAAAAFCLPFGLAVLWEYRVRRISDSQQLELQAELPVVGEVASFPVHRGGSRSLTRSDRGLRLFEESIDSLRTFLVLAQPMRDVQILAVTSATPREGKTCIASQLAVSIARCTGEKTLLIDGDMRKPDIHDIFGVELEPGLAQVLRQEVSLEEAVDTSWSENVHILSAGRLSTSPHQLLGNGALKVLLSEARRRYKHIVIDTPPVLSASEALILSSAADASLVCVMRNRSRIDQVTRSCQRLTEAGAKVVGSVLSGVPVKQYAKYYGDYAYVRS